LDGIINIYKEKGFTSHDVVAVVRKILNQKKVGHTGTLDPDAEGVLPICVGKGTKLADYIMAGQKQYLAEMTLGVTTTTEDSSGNVLEVKDVDFNEEKITVAIKSFVGEIEQIPPMYSAVKINGKKLYELAREGKEVERKSRAVTINDIEIKEFFPPNKVKVLITCSKGTYVRTLLKDIGETLGCGAHMSYLLRTKSGAFEVDNAITLDKLKEVFTSVEFENFILPVSEALKDYNKVYVSEKADKLIHNGCKIYKEYIEKSDYEYSYGDTVIAFDSKELLVGIFTVKKDEENNGLYIRPIKILL